MTITLQMLGTGNAFAKKYYNNNALVHADDYTLMIDCGITAPIALHELGKEIPEIDSILISHIHGDHVGGLEEIGFRGYFVHQRKPVLYIASPLIRPLWDNTLSGGMSQEGIERIEDVFDVKPLVAEHPVQLSPGLKIELIQTPHIEGKNSYSVLINDTTFYSADMKFQPQLLEHLVYERGVRTILHDCQLYPPGIVHTTLDELLSLPQDVRATIKLMHYNDTKDDFVGKTAEMEFIEQHKRYTFPQ
ncbi:MBL fold metallo-hydrolase [Paenibacillus sp. WLX1005]|uniref:MBL fold metallo-hydrolase n=1 Tax=Paenibacillus sp. WLX1005 TaxID=3243766 RepID=UPI00398411DA